MPALFMIKIGGRPKNRLIEQHDMYFGVGETIGDFIGAINEHWPEVKNTWHLDAYRKVTAVNGHQITWQPTKDGSKPLDSELKLFFINLGGYLAGDFEEYHHKLLIVAASQAEAIKQAKQSEFYKKFSFENPEAPFNAASHIDDKQQVDVDEIYDVNDLLTKGRLSIAPFQENLNDDPAFIGYLSLKKLKSLSKNNKI